MAKHIHSFIITRPQPDNQAWVEQLTALGHKALGLPLMEIRPSTSTAAQATLAQVLPPSADWLDYQALMFVSVNAVRYFFAHPSVQAQRPALEAALAQGRLRCWSPGPGTSAALQQAGIPAEAIDAPRAQAAQFESETLWEVVAPQVQAHAMQVQTGQTPAQAVLIVRGTDGRAWLAEQLQTHNVPALFAPIYERCPPQADTAWQAQLAQCRASAGLWVFSSGECVQNLAALAPTTDWNGQCAIATHPRIAQQVQALGFTQIQVCRPALEDLLQAAATFGLAQ